MTTHKKSATNKTILTVAVTGNLTTLEQHPGLPCTPEQIANACLESAKAGAAIAHIHVRYPDGRPSMELDHYREVVERIRDKNSDLIINLTTGLGGRFIPSKDDPKIAAPGTSLVHPLRRVEHIVALKPDIATLDLNTMYSGTAVVINTPENVTLMANAIYEAGSKPELEVFDSGDIQLANVLLAQGVLKSPPLFQIVMGVRYGFIATPQTLLYAQSLLPADAEWAAFGIGRWEFPMLSQAFCLGGHVRVGLEDNIYIRKGVLAPSNAALCEKAAHIVDELGGELASSKEARAILSLRT
ncbi:MAG TPA: 3-keto-5-aminohexanoate cleavage protein [Pseudolabrys sp.]|nr:3-keto-5-aminohexanoate cleavage protein [Pseudolabrys sp.]